MTTKQTKNLPPLYPEPWQILGSADTANKIGVTREGLRTGDPVWTPSKIGNVNTFAETLPERLKVNPYAVKYGNPWFTNDNNVGDYLAPRATADSVGARNLYGNLWTQGSKYQTNGIPQGLYDKYVNSAVKVMNNPAVQAVGKGVSFITNPWVALALTMAKDGASAAADASITPQYLEQVINDAGDEIAPEDRAVLEQLLVQKRNEFYGDKAQ